MNGFILVAIPNRSQHSKCIFTALFRISSDANIPSIMTKIADPNESKTCWVGKCTVPGRSRPNISESYGKHFARTSNLEKNGNPPKEVEREDLAIRPCRCGPRSGQGRYRKSLGPFRSCQLAHTNFFITAAGRKGGNVMRHFCSNLLSPRVPFIYKNRCIRELQ